MRILSALLLLVGCTGAPDEQRSGSTFEHDVYPVFARHCLSCHGASQAAPLRLDNVNKVRAYASRIVEAIETRRMPPWGVTVDGTCGEFASVSEVSAEELDAVRDWIDSGMQSTGAPVASAAADHLDDATHDFAMPERYEPVPSAEGDDYRCFLLGRSPDRTLFVTGTETLPGNTDAVHHASLLSVDADAPSLVSGRTNAQVVAALDEEPRAGWPCYGLAGEGLRTEGMLSSWSIGMGPTRHPEGVGVELSPGRLLILQVHYHPNARRLDDLTRIRLRLATEVERPARILLYDGLLATLGSGLPHVLLPGREGLEFTWERTAGQIAAAAGFAPDTPLEILGALAHMHGTGRSARVELVPTEGDPTCVHELFRYDPLWQRFDFRTDPVPLDASLRMTCGYDTTHRDEAVLPGWSIEDEMCLVKLVLAPVR